ncbi:MAG TPA: hypothetical protein VK815_10650 [Candidatus Acidoferrales bacterium]|jgi:hypothetical protein|nr:hypothetical protein [Candidatus Acidoferrales bacterium]
MKTKLFTLICAAGISLLAGCASQPVALSPVGPEPENHASTAGIGYLQVFSDTETHVIGDGPPYYPHTGYNIYDQSGARIKYVPNHIGNMDESPTLVRVPAGNMKIVAESSAYGRVTVPVVIEGGRTTVVHLDREWQPSSNAASNKLVRLPDGEAVGWRDATAQSSP